MALIFLGKQPTQSFLNVMNNINFTLILNSRGRVPLLKKLFDSIIFTTKDLSQIEIIITIDDDDAPTIAYLEQAPIKERCKVTVICGPRIKNINISFNHMATLAIGRYIFNLNDDVEFLTENWDEIVLGQIADFKKYNDIEDDIIYCYTQDTSVDHSSAEYASFPIISKQACDVIGMFMHPEFVGLGADACVYKIYAGIKRVLKCFVALDHVLHNSLYRVTNPDQTAAEMRANTQENFVDPNTFNVDKEVEKLKEFIGNYGK